VKYPVRASETCRVLLQLIINILLSYITLVFYIYILTYDARKIKHKMYYFLAILIFIIQLEYGLLFMRVNIVINFSSVQFRKHFRYFMHSLLNSKTCSYTHLNSLSIGLENLRTAPSRHEISPNVMEPHVLLPYSPYYTSRPTDEGV
jgi:hypothetical protein